MTMASDRLLVQIRVCREEMGLRDQQIRTRMLELASVATTDLVAGSELDQLAAEQLHLAAAYARLRLFDEAPGQDQIAVAELLARRYRDSCLALTYEGRAVLADRRQSSLAGR